MSPKNKPIRLNLSQTIFCTVPTLLILAFGAASCFAQEAWNQFRGPHGTGAAPADARLTENIDLEHSVVWKQEIPGTGWSSPVYESERAWMTTSISQSATEEQIQQKLEGVQVPEIKTVAATVQLRAICVDLRDGTLLHDRLLDDVENPEIINPLNSYASPTPAISNGKVVCHFGSYGTWCLDEATGELLWYRRFVVDHSVGPGSSPVIFENYVILVCDGMDRQFVACVDLESGRDLWITDRPPFRTTNEELKKAYSTPIVVEIDGQPQAIVPGAQWLVSYDPRTGQERWRADHGSGYSIAPMPIYSSGRIIFATGYNRPEFVAVDPTGSGDVTETHIAWRAKQAPTMSSFVESGGQLFTISETGILMCLDAKTGDVVGRSRLGGNYSASPILSDGKLYLFSREGFASVVTASAEFEPIDRANFDDPIMASPAIYGNDLILRTRKSLYRIKGRDAAVE